MTRANVEDLLARLVEIDSVNPTLVPGGRGEAAIAAFVAAWLADAGLEVRTEDVAPGRPNVVAQCRGIGEGRTLMLNVHLDTVGVGGMAEPFRPIVEGGRLRGRGAADTKGGLAAALLTMAELVGSPRLRGDVIFAGVIDEECASIGTEALAESVRADGAIVLEPTDLTVVTCHKGFVWAEIVTEGIAAHGSLPDVGVDGIARMGPVLARLQAYSEELSGRPGHPVLGTPSVHASLIEGGQELSSYPARCLLQLERRTIPGESIEDIEGELRRIAGPHGRARVTLARWPLDAQTEGRFTSTVLEAVAQVRPDGHAAWGGISGWTDAAILAQAGISSVVFGPSGEGFHGDDEWVDVDSVERCAEALLRAANGYCN
jgi:acetylornithine deacetylase